MCVMLWEIVFSRMVILILIQGVLGQHVNEHSHELTRKKSLWLFTFLLTPRTVNVLML